MVDRNEKNKPSRWFILSVADRDTGCPMLEVRFPVSDIAGLRKILGADDRDPELEWVYSLRKGRLAEIENMFGASIADAEGEVTMRPFNSGPWPPYLVHTGFELALMLEGRKPFAKFSDGYPSEYLDELLGRFDPFVRAGRFVARTVMEAFSRPRRSFNRTIEGIRYFFVALPGEEWRIDACLLLQDVGLKAGWNDALERYEGCLLGYEDWQNDWWIEHIRSTRPPALGGGRWTRTLKQGRPSSNVSD